MPASVIGGVEWLAGGDVDGSVVNCQTDDSL